MHAMIPVILSLCVLAVPSADRASERSWGTSKAGVQLSLSIPDKVEAGGKLPVEVALRNVGSAGVEMPAAGDIFGWLMLSYGRDNAHATERVHPAAQMTKGRWPKVLAAGKTIDLPAIDLSAHGVFSTREKRTQAYTAYLKPETGGTAPRPDGTLAAKLTSGTARARFMLYVPRPGQTPLLLSSNIIDLRVAPPTWEGLSQAERKQFAADLIAKFDRDAWSGKTAHEAAVAAGPGIVPYLVEAIDRGKRPGHSRQWITTAIAKIRCEASARWLVKALGAPRGDLRQIVAYYGPIQRSDSLDAAIVAKAASAGGGGITARAVVGFLVFRRRVPEPLLAASFESKDPKARAALAAALKAQAGDSALSGLVSLLSDENPRVRSAAAKALGAMGRATDAVVGALVRSLAAPGESARQSIAAALTALTGRDGPYDPNAAAAARAGVLAGWRSWWAAKLDAAGKGKPLR